MDSLQPVSKAQQLRDLLASGEIITMPTCGDGLSARLIEQAGFRAAFMGGFAASAHRLGQPDAQLISYAEMADQLRNICAATALPVIGDGDTGYGNAMNVKRTVKGYAQAGAAAIMIEDQVAPKRCGHTKGKLVVDRIEAIDRIKAAVDAREEGADILIMARTDARRDHGLDEALERAAAFKAAGADMLFVEEPQSREEMEQLCRDVPGHHMANMLEGGLTPVLPPAELQQVGFALAAYPLTLMSAAMKAMIAALDALKSGRRPDELLLDFAEVRRRIGFDDYYKEEQRYVGARGD